MRFGVEFHHPVECDVRQPRGKLRLSQVVEIAEPAIRRRHLKLE
jgi:hypothetical protein